MTRSDYKKDYSVVGAYRAKTTKVGSFSANSLGLFDMSGNVCESCQDVYHDTYKDAPTDGSAWTSGGDNSARVCRGGSWGCHPLYCRSSMRSYYITLFGYNDIGFRLARH